MPTPNTETVSMRVDRDWPTKETIDLVTDVNRFMNTRNIELAIALDTAISTMRDVLVDENLECIPRPGNADPCACSTARAHRIIEAHANATPIVRETATPTRTVYDTLPLREEQFRIDLDRVLTAAETFGEVAHPNNMPTGTPGSINRLRSAMLVGLVADALDDTGSGTQNCRGTIIDEYDVGEATDNLRCGDCGEPVADGSNRCATHTITEDTSWSAAQAGSVDAPDWQARAEYAEAELKQLRRIVPATPELISAAHDACNIIGAIPAARTAWNEDGTIGIKAGLAWNHLNTQLERHADDAYTTALMHGTDHADDDIPF